MLRIAHSATSGEIPKVAVAAIMLMLAWTSVIWPGFGFPSGNNIYHVPIVLHYASSAEGPHDAFTRSLDHFVSGVWPTLGLIATERNVYWVFFFAQLATRLIFVVGFYALLRCFSLPRLVCLALTGVTAFAPIFRSESPVGRGDTLSTFFGHSELAIALGPVAWTFILRRRWIAAAATIGVMFDANAFVAMWNGVAAAAALLASRVPRKRIAREIAACAVTFAAIALPIMIWIFETVSRSRPAFSFGQYLRLYYPFHTFIDVQWASAARYAAYFVAGVAALRVVWGDMQGAMKRTLAMLLAAFAAIFLIGIPLPYVTDQPLLLELYPLRADSEVNLLFGVFLLAWAGRGLAKGQRERDTLPLAVAVSFLAGNMIAGLLILRLRSGQGRIERLTIDWAMGLSMGLLLASGSAPALAAGAIPLKFVFGSIALCAAFADRSPNGAVIAPVTAALACSILPALPVYPLPILGLALVVALAIASNPWAGLLAIAEMLWAISWSIKYGELSTAGGIALLALLAAALCLPRPKPIGRLARSAVAPVALLAGIAVTGLARSAYAVARSSLSDPRENSEAKSAAQLWVRAHVAPDEALLIIDPSDVDGFQTMSRRPVWVDAQVGAAVMWEPAFFPEWRRRTEELQRCGNARCYAALAHTNGLTWVVAPQGHLADARSAGLQLKFRNALYEIYCLPAPAPPSLPSTVVASRFAPCAAPR
jgi:hypothetical protein